MARIVYAPNALTDLERLFDFLSDRPDLARAAMRTIANAVELLEHHPLIGRIAVREPQELRELVISYGRTGYVALYRFVAATDEVRILAIRHQRELDYPAA